MEFVRVGKNYLIKNSNGRIISEKEKLQLENKELILKDFKGCGCQQETTKKLSKNKKRLKEIANEEIEKQIIDNKIYVNGKLIPKDTKEYKVTALQDKENADETIKETVSTNK